MSNYAHITATSQIKIGAGKLKGIIVSSGTTPTVAVYDSSKSLDSDPVVIAQFTGATPGFYPIPGDEQGLFFKTGLYVVLGGVSPKVTVIFD